MADHGRQRGGRDHERRVHDKAVFHTVLPPGNTTRATAARFTSPTASKTAICEVPMAAVRQTARPSHSTAMPPLHAVTPILNLRNELPGVLDGCQPIVLPRAPSQIAKTCAQLRAIPSGQTDGP